MLCHVCHIGTAIVDPTLGVLPCAACTTRRQSFLSPRPQVEFTSESIKSQRKQQRRDFLPMHNRGELDKAWVDRYGVKKAKQRGFSDKEIKHAKYVWKNEASYYQNEK